MLLYKNIILLYLAGLKNKQFRFIQKLVFLTDVKEN